MKKIIKIVFSILVMFAFSAQTVFAEDKDTTLNSSDTPPAYGREMTEAERKEAEKKALEEKEKNDSEKVNIETPASVTGEKYQGTGTITDFSTSGSKAFYTIVDNEQNVFYLIIDMDKVDNNVYFLSDINKSELEGQTTNNQTASNQVDNNQVQTNDQTADVNAYPAPSTSQESNSSSNTFLWIVLGVAGVGLVAYYFLVFKNKKNKPATETETEAGEIPEDTMYEDDVFSDEDRNE